MTTYRYWLTVKYQLVSYACMHTGMCVASGQTYVHMYVCMYVWMYVRMYVWIYV